MHSLHKPQFPPHDCDNALGVGEGEGEVPEDAGGVDVAEEAREEDADPIGEGVLQALSGRRGRRAIGTCARVLKGEQVVP